MNMGFEVAPAVTFIAHTVLLMLIMVGFRIVTQPKDE